MLRVFICLGCGRRRRLLHIGHVEHGKGFICTACVAARHP